MDDLKTTASNPQTMAKLPQASPFQTVTKNPCHSGTDNRDDESDRPT